MTSQFDRTIHNVIGSWVITLLLLAGLAGLSLAAKEPAESATITTADRS